MSEGMSNLSNGFRGIERFFFGWTLSWAGTSAVRLLVLKVLLLVAL